MKSTNVALFSTILDRIVEKVADNLRIAKILIQLGLDPDNVTYAAISNRLFEIFIANITIANICALVGATFLVATLLTLVFLPVAYATWFGHFERRAEAAGAKAAAARASA